MAPFIYMNRFQILKGLPPPEKKVLPEGINKKPKYVPPGVYVAPIYLGSSIPDRNGRIYPNLEDYSYLEQRVAASLGITDISLKEEAQRYLGEQP